MPKKRQDAVPSGGKASTLSLRIPAKLRNDLDEAVKKGGRLLSDEVADRLERSFRLDEERAHLHDAFGGKKNHELFMHIVELMRGLKAAFDRDWTDSGWVADQTAQGAAELIRGFGLKEDHPEVPKLLKKLPGGGGPEHAGLDLAMTIIIFS